RTSVRTVLMGHTHYNSLEMLKSGDEIVPPSVAFDKDQDRLSAEEREKKKKGLTVENNRLYQDLLVAGHNFNREIQGDHRDLAMLRMTSSADMTSQRF